MKTILLSLSFLSFSFAAFSQIPAGTKMIGGSFGGSINRSENSFSETEGGSFSLGPRYAWAKKENRVNGISAMYSYSSNKNVFNNQTQKSTNQFISLSYFSQRYLPIGNAFMVYGEGNIGGTYGWQRGDYDMSDTYSAIAGIGAGIAYNVKNKALLTLSIPNAVSASVSYQKYDYSNTNNSYQNSFGIGLNTAVSLNTLQFGFMLML